MENYFFMRPLLRLLGHGPFVYKTTSVLLRALSALVILGSLATFFNAGKLIFELPTTSAIFGGIVYQLFFIIAIYAVAHVLMLRAKDIEHMHASVGDIYMLPLSAILLRMIGEAYAAFVTLLAIGGSIFVWFTGKTVASLLGPLTAFFPAMQEATFISGIQFMMSGFLLAVASFILSYMLAEIITLVSRSTRALTHNPRQLPRQAVKSRVGQSNNGI